MGRPVRRSSGDIDGHQREIWERGGRRNVRTSVDAEDAQRDIRVPGVPRRGARSARACREVRIDGAPVPPSVPDGSPRDVEVTWRLDAPRVRGRTEARRGRHDRGLGPVLEESRRRLVWAEEGPAGSVRNVRSPRLGGARPRGGRAQPEEQPDAGPLGPANADDYRMRATTRSPMSTRPRWPSFAGPGLIIVTSPGTIPAASWM